MWACKEDHDQVNERKVPLWIVISGKCVYNYWLLRCSTEYDIDSKISTLGNLFNFDGVKVGKE